jgi:hypothetical protein
MIFGLVHLALAHAQPRIGYEKWAILNDDPTILHTFDEYGLRFNLEENFLGDKPAGFHLALQCQSWLLPHACGYTEKTW